MERGSDQNSFIRTGQPEAIVTVWLQDEGGKDVEVTRTLTRNGGGGRSQFQINGVKTPAEEVMKVMEHFSIQMDNSCMFLPQEKIGKFTELSSDSVSGAIT